MADDRADLPKGTLELLILSTLVPGPMHGWGITQRIEHLSRRVLLVNQGSLYPALERLVRKGSIRDAWRTTENNRRARYYELTEDGRKELAIARGEWERSCLAVHWVLDQVEAT